jgi:hypothetical protein
MILYFPDEAEKNFVDIQRHFLEILGQISNYFLAAERMLDLIIQIKELQNFLSDRLTVWCQNQI